MVKSRSKPVIIKNKKFEEYLREFLMSDKDTISIEEAKRRAEKRWPTN